MQFKRAVLSDTLKLYTEKLMLRTPLGACNDNWGNGLPQPFRRLRNDEKGRERIAAHLTAVSPAGSVGASASQKFVPLVIREGPETQPIGFPAALSPISVRAEIGCPRGTSVKRLYFLKRENGLPQPFTRLRNDKKLVILNAKREKIRNTIKGLS